MSLQGEEMTLDAFKSNVEDMALEEMSRLTERRDELQSELNSVNESIKGVRTILRTINPKPKRVRSASKTKQQVSPEMRTRFIEWATGHEGDITSRMISDAFGLSRSYGTLVAKQMREEGVLRLSAQSGPTNIYRSEV